MAFEENALSNRSNDFRAPAQESSPETGPSLRLVEAFENGAGETTNDVSDMRRLGKKQEFRVRKSSSCHRVRFAELRWTRGISASLQPWASYPYIWLPGSLSWCMRSDSAFGYAVSSLLTLSRSLSVGLLNGGFAGLFWVFIGTVVCYSTVVVSLAEMESM